MDSVEVKCLGCKRSIKLPKSMKIELYDGQPIAFCSKSCNYKFINEEATKHREQEMRDLIKRLESNA